MRAKLNRIISRYQRAIVARNKTGLYLRDTEALVLAVSDLINAALEEEL